MVQKNLSLLMGLLVIIFILMFLLLLSHIKKSAISLENKQETLAAILDNAADAIFTFTKKGYIKSLNMAAINTFGYEPDEVIGLNIVSLIPNLNAKSLEEFVENSSNEKDASEAFVNEPILAKHKNGVIFPISIALSHTAIDSTVSFIVIIHDLSVSKAFEKQLILAKTEAEKANMAKSEFLSNMSHELRTPLNAIMGFSQLLEYDDQLDESQLENVYEISKAGAHLLTLINEVLDLAKVESGKLELSVEPLQIDSLFKDCIALIKPLAEKYRISLEYSCDSSLTVLADQTRLKQVIINLLSNAIKYNKENGCVVLKLDISDNGQLCFSVQDTGVGISEQNLKLLFEPFKRINDEDPTIEGTGIGLSFTKKMIELMGGEIQVKSVLGIGSTFWFELPAASKIDRDKEIRAIDNIVLGSSSIDQQQQFLVLYIEDNPINLNLVKKILGKFKQIKLMEAHTSELGIEIALLQKPDLILLDINMPNMDGYQVLSVLKADEKLKETPVFALTANAMPRDIKKGIAAGFSEYLVKPLNVLNFINTVELYLKNIHCKQEREQK